VDALDVILLVFMTAGVFAAVGAAGGRLTDRVRWRLFLVGLAVAFACLLLLLGRRGQLNF
jgi:hypothetical protein